MKGLLFTYLLTYGGVMASVVNPFIGLLIYVCFAIIKPDSLWSYSVPEGNYSRVIAGGLFVGWALTGCGRWRLGRARGMVLALVAFWLWSVLSAAFASNQPLAWDFVESKAKIFLPFVVGITLIDSVQRLKQLAWVIVLSQGYVAYELNLAYLGGFNQVHELGFGGMDNNCVSIAMVSCVGPAFFLGLHARRWWWKLLAFSLAALMGHTVLLSFSRGGMLALILVGLLSFLLIPKQPKHYLILLLAVLLGLRLAGPEVRQRFMTFFAAEEERDESAQSRLDLWAGCWDITINHPLLGVGPDHFPLIAEDYGWKAGKHAHTLWLAMAAELGIPGLLYLLSFYGLCLARLWPLVRKRPGVIDPDICTAARMVVASVAGFMLATQFVTVPGLEVPYYVALIGAGALKLSSNLDAAAATASLPAARPTFDFS